MSGSGPVLEGQAFFLVEELGRERSVLFIDEWQQSFVFGSAWLPLVEADLVGNAQLPFPYCGCVAHGRYPLCNQ